MKPKILFVDDEPHVLSGLKRALHDRRDVWDMTFAEGSKAGLIAFRQGHFEVVVSDLAMPGLDGLNMIVEMRKVRRDMAFIILTGTAELAKAVDAINTAEVYRFFTKPCAIDLLIDGIVAALESLRSQSANKNERLDYRAASSISDTIGMAALNRLAIGVLVVDPTARVLTANQAGGRALAARDGLSLGPNEICRASSTGETALLHDAILAATRRPASAEDESHGIPISRPSLKRPFNVLVMPLNVSDLSARETSDCLAVIFVTDPDEQQIPSAQMIQKLFGLSPAEGRLARALSGGQDIQSAAEACGITIGTARSYLKQIFSKTATSRQSELVMLMLTAPPIA